MMSVVESDLFVERASSPAFHNGTRESHAKTHEHRASGDARATKSARRAQVVFRELGEQRQRFLRILSRSPILRRECWATFWKGRGDEQAGRINWVVADGCSHSRCSRGSGVVHWLPLVGALQRERMHDNVARCGDNLCAIAKAMEAYSNDYDDALPVAGGRGTRWTGRLRDWSACDRSQAFALDPNASGGEATISSSLYLLVRYMQLDPKSFVCPVDRGTQEFRAKEYGPDTKTLADLWDFGPNASRHCSYAYQMVYGPYKLTTSSFFGGPECGFAVGADRNPWIDGPAERAGEFSSFMPDLRSVGYTGTTEQALPGNASAHRGWANRRDGQNVLFLDTHVTYEKRAYCGLEDDNIYTSWDGKDKVRGKPPRLGSQPGW